MVDDYQYRFDILEKQIDDLLWLERLGDVAFIDKVRLTSFWINTLTLLNYFNLKQK